MCGEFCSWFHKALKMQAMYPDSNQPRLDLHFEMQLGCIPFLYLYIPWLFWHYINLAYMIIAKQN